MNRVVVVDGNQSIRVGKGGSNLDEEDSAAQLVKQAR